MKSSDEGKMPTGVFSQKPVEQGYAYHPFEALKLIRDGVVRSRRDLLCVGTLYYHQYSNLLNGLISLGMLKQSGRKNKVKSYDEFAPTQKFYDFFESLQISLTMLEKLNSRACVLNPVFDEPQTYSLKADVFVVMPFAKAFNATYQAIRAAADDLGMTVVRGDEYKTAHAVISDIWSAILHAKVIVADTTGLNANVFYEIGMAHTLGKQVVLLSQDVKKLPFDLQHLRAINYESNRLGLEIMQSHLKRSLEAVLTIPTSLAALCEAARSEVDARQKPVGKEQSQHNKRGKKCI